MHCRNLAREYGVAVAGLRLSTTRSTFEREVRRGRAKEHVCRSRYLEELRNDGRRIVSPLHRPKITHQWISRWRTFYSIVPGTITCSYEVSYAKKLRRLGVTWRNATRLLVFHEALFGPDKLTLISLDEKPYRFNACGGDKVWATRGQKAVKCKELRTISLNAGPG